MNPAPACPDGSHGFARLLAGVAEHRDAVLLDWLQATGRMTKDAVQAARVEQERRRAIGETTLLEAILLQAGVLDERDIAAAFAEGASGDGPRYDLRERLGEGAGGVVYRAHDRRLDRFVAIKVLKASSDDDVGTFDEGASLARLRHPNLVTVYDAGRLDGRPFVATEWVDGVTLATVLARGDTGLRPLVQCVAEVARGLGAAHRLGIVHRDVKPTNVLVDAEGKARVCDFGLATAIGERNARRGGTPHFLAPEQYADAPAAPSPANDVYGAGALLYQVLVGVPPFARLDGAALRHAVVHSDPMPPQALARVPAELSAIAMRALARAPAGRYTDGDDLALDLEAWLRGEPVRARAAALPVRWWRAVRRRPAVTGGVVAVTLAAMVVALFAWSRFERSNLRAQLLGRMQQSAELGLEAVLRLRRAGDVGGMAALAQPVALACTDVLAVFPDEGRPHLLLSSLYRTTMQFVEARRHVDLAAERLPDDPDVRFERGMLAVHFALLAQQRQREAAQRQELWRGAGGWARARWRALFGDPDELDRSAIEGAIADLRASVRPQAQTLAAALSGPGLIAGFDLPPATATAFDAEVFAWLASAAMLRGDGVAAEAWATRGHELDRGYGRHLLLRAAAKLHGPAAGDCDANARAVATEAIDRDLRAAMALQPHDADLHERCAVVWLGWHDAGSAAGAATDSTALANAILALAQATRTAPEAADRWHGLAITRLEAAERQGLRGDAAGAALAQAHTDLDRALQLDPDRAAFHESMGHLQIAGQRRGPRAARAGAAHTAALRAFERAGQLAPRHVGPHLGRAMTLRLAGKRDEAVAGLERVLVLLPECEPVVAPFLQRMRR